MYFLQPQPVVSTRVARGRRRQVVVLVAEVLLVEVGHSEPHECRRVVLLVAVVLLALVLLVEVQVAVVLVAPVALAVCGVLVVVLVAVFVGALASDADRISCVVVRVRVAICGVLICAAVRVFSRPKWTERNGSELPLK